jgi:hypothetical protein
MCLIILSIIYNPGGTSNPTFRTRKAILCRKLHQTNLCCYGAVELAVELRLKTYGGFPQWGYPKMDGIMGNPINMDDFL